MMKIEGVVTAGSLNPALNIPLTRGFIFPIYFFPLQAKFY